MAPRRTSTPVGCGEAAVYVDDTGRTTAHLHALDRDELETWSKNPRTAMEDLRIVPNGTLVAVGATVTVEHRTFVEVVEGEYAGLYVTQSRTPAAVEPWLTAPTPLFRLRGSTFCVVGFLACAAAWNHPRCAAAVTLGAGGIIGSGAIGWGLRRLYYRHDFFKNFVMSVPVPFWGAVEIPL